MMNNFYQELEEYLQTKELKELSKQRTKSSKLYDKIIARLNKLYADLTDEEGNYRYDYYKTQQIKREAFKEIQAWLDNSYALLFAFLAGAFVYAYNAHLQYLLQNAPTNNMWGSNNVTPPSPIDAAIAKMRYEYEISGMYGQRALTNSHNKLLTDVYNIVDKINTQGLTQVQATKQMDYAFAKYNRRQARIYRTEEHRVEELAKFISAQDLLNAGYNVQKTWHTKQDDRVRDTDRADHVHLEGQEKPLNEPYLLIPSGTIQQPGGSGIAEQDINCRCKSEYKIV